MDSGPDLDALLDAHDAIDVFAALSDQDETAEMSTES